MEITQVKSRIIIGNSHILKPSYHMNYGKKRIEKAIYNEFPFDSLGNVSASVFTGGIFKRMFVDDAKYGYPYISAQHMMNTNPLDVAKIISKKYTPRQEEMSLKESQILVSCAGTVGNVRLITKDLEGVIGSQDIIRVNPDDTKLPYGYLYAYLASKTAYNYMQSYIYGSVVPRIEPNTLSRLPIPILSEEKQQQIHQLIVEASDLRVEANRLLNKVEIFLKESLDLQNLEKEDYEYFGNHAIGRDVSTFVRKAKEITSISINAFNYSKRIEKIIITIRKKKYLNLEDCLNQNKFFSTGSFRRLETNSINGIKLLNQSDIFDIHKKGKILSRHFVGNVKLVEYGEVLIAGVGTLGEGETFCRAIFANEELESQLISGEFIRMKTNEKIPSGYLFAWLNSNYGFRLIRSTQTGTKLCRPIPNLLAKIPVPLMDMDQMNYIDKNVRKAHTDFYEAIVKENQAIALIEKEIDLWQAS